MKFGKLMKNSVRNNFSITFAEKEVGRLVPDLFFFKKALYQVKAIGHLSFNIFW